MTQTIAPPPIPQPLPLPAIHRPHPAASPSSSSPAPTQAPAPARAAGLIACLFGLLVLASVITFDGSALLGLRSGGELILTRSIVAAVACTMGALGSLAFLGGLLLAFGRRSGRTLLLAFAWGVIVLMPAALLATGIASDAAESRSLSLEPQLWLHVGLGAACVLIALVLGFLLLGSRATRWADRKPQKHVAALPPPLPRLSVPALLSLIFAFLPPFFVMQIVSLALGTRALGTIRRSNGSRTGRGLAIAGASISLTILLAASAVCATSAGLMLKEASAHNVRDEVTDRLREIDLAQRLYMQLNLNPEAPGAACHTNLSDLLAATAPYQPLDPQIAQQIRSANPTGSDAPTAYHDYWFKMARWAARPNEDANHDWLVFAWPITPDSDRPALMLDTTGQISLFPSTIGQPPTTLTREEYDTWHVDHVLSAR